VDGKTQLSLPEFTRELQGRIIFSVAVGNKYWDQLLPMEQKDGTVKQVPIYHQFVSLIEQFVMRTLEPFNMAFPELMGYTICSSDRRWGRNIRVVKDFCAKIIAERRKEESKADNQDGADLLSILLKDEIHKDDDNLIIDEILTFFLAGMFTVQISSTNLIYYLT